jgi:surface protein
MNLFGDEVNLNWIDVSDITDMSYLFEDTEFNGDISKWNVSNVTNMTGMFWNTKFNGDISNWDVSKVLDMNHMFSICPFNGDISKWDVSHVKDIRRMFSDATEFNQDISNWDLRSVTDARNMFRNCSIKEEYKPKKMKINESFNFSSVNKSKNHTNIYTKFHEILGKTYSEITEEDKDFINLFPDGIYKVQDKDELKKIIKRSIRLLGYDCKLNWIDVSNITDMSNLF